MSHYYKFFFICILLVYLLSYFYYRKKTVHPKKNNQKEFFSQIRSKFVDKKAAICTDCANFESILKNKNREIQQLQEKILDQENLLQKKNEKYKIMKQKYKEKKRQLREKQEEPQEENKIKFGSIMIPKQKVSLCRANHYSKYVGDLLLVCFGHETLSESVLRCPNKRSAKTHVLDEEIINDVICHTIEKFEHVSVSMVRGAIRQKLNTCHKAKKIK